MRKVLAVLAASLLLAAAAGSLAQSAPTDPTPASAPELFKDVPPEHWAYAAVDDLQKKGVVVGYPDGYFRGKRTLTRYEFAIALRRALDWVLTHARGEKGEAGAAGPAGAAGADGAAGKDGSDAEVGPLKEDIARAQASVGDLQKLLDEFKKELGGIGGRVSAAEKKLQGLAKDVKDLKTAWGNSVKVSGEAFVGVRSDRANGEYYDIDGSTLNRELVNSPVVVHQLAIGLSGKVGSTGTVVAKIVSGNYLDYRAGTFAFPRSVNTTPASDTYLDQLQIAAPFTALGTGGKLTIGRITHNISPLTLWKPNFDRYFDNPIANDGLFRMDGVRLESKLGSVGLELFGGQTRSVVSRDGDGNSLPVNNPNYHTEQLGGLNLTLPIRGIGEGGKIRGTAYESTDSHGLNQAVLGAGADLNLSGRLSFSGEWAKALVGQGKQFGSIVSSYNQAFIGGFTYATGPARIGAGYNYVDAAYYAPGYWGWAGNSMNPHNVKGPTFSASYDLSPSFGLKVGAGLFTGARNAGVGLAPHEQLNDVHVGARWALSNTLILTCGWEAVYQALYDVEKSGAGWIHPTQQYLTLGTGYSLNEAMTLKLGYQIGTSRYPSTQDLSNYSYNVFTTQLHVKF